MKTLDDAPDAAAEVHVKVVVAFIHVEPKDTENHNSVETKLVKHAKWLARKWDRGGKSRSRPGRTSNRRRRASWRR